MNVFLYFSDKLTTAYFKDSVWYGLTKLHASTDRFKFFKLKEIFTTEHGFKSFVKLVIGWAFNLLTSTYGLILIGFLFSIIVIWYAFRKKKREHFSVAERIVAAFGTLLFLGSYAQGCLFFYSPADRIFQGKVHVRLDRLIYGRYMACAIGILVLLALYILIFKSDLFKWKIKASCVAVHIGVLIFFFGVVMKYLADGEAAVRYFMELSTFLKLPSKRQTMGDFDQLDEALLAAAILGLLVSCIIFVFSVRNMKVKTALCTFVLILTGVLTSVNFYNVRLARDQYMTGKITPVKNYIIDMGDLYEDYPVLCTDKKAATIGTYQLPLRNYKLVETENKLALETDNMLIITRENKISEELMENDIYYFADYPYNPNEDVPYVKGKELKNRLTELGYDLIKY